MIIMENRISLRSLKIVSLIFSIISLGVGMEARECVQEK